jgi:hypothetical protein
VLPLKLHVDQDTLDFITRFFEFKDQSDLPTNGIVPEPPFLRILLPYLTYNRTCGSITCEGDARL